MLWITSEVCDTSGHFRCNPIFCITQLELIQKGESRVIRSKSYSFSCYNRNKITMMVSGGIGSNLVATLPASSSSTRTTTHTRHIESQLDTNEGHNFQLQLGKILLMYLFYSIVYLICLKYSCIFIYNSGNISGMNVYNIFIHEAIIWNSQN